MDVETAYYIGFVAGGLTGMVGLSIMYWYVQWVRVDKEYELE